MPMYSNNDTAFRIGCLAFLTVQNSALILTMRYSRTLSGEKYQTSTAVLLAEALKCVISYILYRCIRPRCERIQARESKNSYNTDLSTQPTTTESDSTYSRVLRTSKDSDFVPLLVPSFLYAIQNNLQFVAVSNLEAATFQVLYQGKLLTTAICAIIFLGKKISMMQLYSIILLSAGVACASIQSNNKFSKVVSQKKALDPQNHSLGVAAVSLACIISGFAGVYTESILKKTQSTRNDGIDSKNNNCQLWLRNFQLSLSGLAFASFGIFIIDRQTIMENGFWYGYHSAVWVTIILQAVGGLAVAVVITYSDNILKGFATSISVVLSTVASALLWDFEVTPLFMVGTLAVLVATHMYSLPGSSGVLKRSADREEELGEIAELPEHMGKEETEVLVRDISYESDSASV